MGNVNHANLKLLLHEYRLLLTETLGFCTSAIDGVETLVLCHPVVAVSVVALRISRTRLLMPP